MLISMTGYGRDLIDNDVLSCETEIKTLNSKFLDIQLKLPKAFADREMEIRQKITEQMVRGKVSVSIVFQDKVDASSVAKINENLFVEYYKQLNTLQNKVIKEIPNTSQTPDIFKLALEIPEVIQLQELGKAYDQEWEVVNGSLDRALEKCLQHRKAEGLVLQNKLKEYIQTIAEKLEEVIRLDPDRQEQMKERVKQKVTDLEGVQIDENRLEQELIYYLEKLDIAEEKVRLKRHLEYFNTVIAESASQGKKLGFISQEIGREINTIGSKANHAGIQRLVVDMKEELEKIKEQMLNLV